MHMRPTRVQSSPDQIEQTITNFKGTVMPPAKQAMGYAGAALCLNRKSGEAAEASTARVAWSR